MDKPKRRRLAKACDGCHKSKRRCDGTDPCSNCYFASKACTYTDSSGRPVAPPRNPDPQPAPSHHYQYPQPQPSYSVSSRKRPRSDLDPDALDPLLIRELTSLFFAHAQPFVAIIHKPTFCTALAHNQVPLYLLHAMSAIASRHSKQPSLKTSPSRFAGRRFADSAVSLMFDSSGRLIAPTNLQTAQTLCLLSVYIVVSNQDQASFDPASKDKSPAGWISAERFRALSLQLIEAMNVHTPEHPLITPVPSAALINESIERECVRRIFWMIYIMDCTRSIYFGWQGGASSKASNIGGGVLGFSEAELRLRLPVDETSFELGTVHQSLPEYLYLPAVRTHYASEMGHLVRVITICQKIEWALDTLIDPQVRETVMECEKLLDEWSSSLPAHLLFSVHCLAVQKTMFETASNLGAWCYAAIHVYYASCSLGIIVARQRFAEQDHVAYHVPDISFIMDRIYAVKGMLLGRTNQSLILGVVIWPLVKYLNHSDNVDVATWLDEFDDMAGVRMDLLVRNRWGDQTSSSSLCLRQPTPCTVTPLTRLDRTDLDLDPTLVSPAEKSFYSVPGLSQNDKKLLPSLKASGLLEWSNPPGSSGPPSALSDRRASTSSEGARSLPMGMSWLADDSR